MQRKVHRHAKFVFPGDFPERLVRFKEASGMSWRSMAQLLGVSPYRLREWRFKGVVPGSAHLFNLLTLADRIGLRDGVLMCPDRDIPTACDCTPLGDKVSDGHRCTNIIVNLVDVDFSRRQEIFKQGMQI